MRKNNITKLHGIAFSVFVLGAALVFTTAFRDAFYSPKILLGALFLLYLIYTEGPENIFSSPLFRPAALFLFIAGVVLVVRGRFAFGGGNFAGMVVVFLILLAVSSVSAGDLKDRVADALVLSLFLVSLYAVLQHYGLAGRFGRFAGQESIMPISTFGNRVYLADYILLALPFAALAAKKKPLMGGASVLVALWALYLSSALRALPGLIALSAVFFYYCRGREKKVYAFLCGALVLLSGALFYAGRERVMEKHLRPRLQVWRLSRDMFLSGPVFGLGAGTFAYEYPRHQEEFFRDEFNLRHALATQRSLPIRAQSDFIQILTETGVAGFVLVAWLFYLWFKKAGTDPGFAVPARAGVCAVLLSSLVGFPFHRPAVALTLAVVMGLAAGERSQSPPLPPSPGKWLKGLLIALGLFMVFLKAGEQVFWEKGRRAFEGGMYDEAVNQLETAEIFSHLPGGILYLKGRAWDRKGLYHIAEAEYGRAMLTYRHSALYYSRALALVRMREYGRAEVFLKKAIYTTPKFENPYRTLIDLYYQLSLEEKVEKYEKMLRDIKKGE